MEDPILHYFYKDPFLKIDKNIGLTLFGSFFEKREKYLLVFVCSFKFTSSLISKTQAI